MLLRVMCRMKGPKEPEVMLRSMGPITHEIYDNEQDYCLEPGWQWLQQR